jgi:hypothetical protein
MSTRTLTTLFLLAATGVCPAIGQTRWKVANTFAVGGEGSWDYLTVDAKAQRLYVPRSTHTLVLDAKTGKTIADIPGQKIAHGVAIVPEAGRGFITDGGGEGAIQIFDLKTNVTLGSIVAQPDADGVIYDAFSKRVIAVSGDKGVLMAIKPDVDPKAGKIETTIELGGAPEFLASDGAGRIFVNLMDKNEVAVVDLAGKKVAARWPVAPGGAPVGMSIDVQKKRIFIGCRKPQQLIVMSTVDGKVVADLPIGAGVDATKVIGNQAFASCRDGSLAVAEETSAGKFAIVQTVTTPEGARTMGVDPDAHRIFLPTAKFEVAAPGSKGRPKTVPGSFVVVVVERQ